MSDVNQHKGTGRLGVEPKIFTGESGSKVAKLFALLNESYVDKAGEKHENTLPVNLVLFKPEHVNLVETSLHTGAAISWQGKLTHRTYDDEHGKKHTVYEVAITGLGAKFEVAAAKAKAAKAAGNRPKADTAARPAA